jgi:hypothetical protein
VIERFGWDSGVFVAQDKDRAAAGYRQIAQSDRFVGQFNSDHVTAGHLLTCQPDASVAVDVMNARLHSQGVAAG